MGGIVVRLVTSILCASLAWLLLAIGLDRSTEPPAARGWDAIVVLGCRVRIDGRPSPSLDRRVRHAVGLWRRGLAPRIVLTGGVGEGTPISEARAAARLARSLGVPDEALVLEERSTSTEENARFAREALGPGRVVIVSDAYHVARGERVFARHFDAVATAGVRGAPMGGALREVLALAIYGLLGRLDDDRLPPTAHLARRAVAVVEDRRPRLSGDRTARRRGTAARRGRPRPRACGAAIRRAARSATHRHRTPCPR